MRKVYEAWGFDSCITLGKVDSLKRQREQGLLDTQAKLLFRIEADSPEEAMAIRNIKLGWAPFVPSGLPADCPKGCGAKYYPKGSGECPNCGLIDYELRPEPEDV